MAFVVGMGEGVGAGAGARVRVRVRVSRLFEAQIAATIYQHPHGQTHMAVAQKYPAGACGGRGSIGYTVERATSGCYRLSLAPTPGCHFEATTSHGGSSTSSVGSEPEPWLLPLPTTTRAWTMRCRASPWSVVEQCSGFFQVAVNVFNNVVLCHQPGQHTNSAYTFKHKFVQACNFI